MKHMKTLQLPAYEEDVIDRVTCDSCGEVMLEGMINPGHFAQVKPMCVAEGVCDGGLVSSVGYQATDYDICSICFIEKFKPLFMADRTTDVTGW